MMEETLATGPERAHCLTFQVRDAYQIAQVLVAPAILTLLLTLQMSALADVAMKPPTTVDRVIFPTGRERDLFLLACKALPPGRVVPTAKMALNSAEPPQHGVKAAPKMALDHPAENLPSVLLLKELQLRPSLIINGELGCGRMLPLNRKPLLSL